MSDQFLQHTFDNGLTLLAERMPAMQSAAMTLLIPAGAASDPADRRGSATVLSDMILRGAGNRDNRALTDYLDGLGLQRSASVGVYHTRLGCAALAPKVMEGLPTYADIVRRPRLEESGFEPARDLALQALAGIEDDPRHKLLIKLRETFLPSPYGLNSMGEPEHLQKLTHPMCKQDFQQRYHPRNAILSVAGKIEFKQLQSEVQRWFGDWKGKPTEPIRETPANGSYLHEHQQSEQTHIGIACPSVPETDPDYYVIRMAVEILSGGMSGRLFTEIREKRALVYNVSASYFSLKDRAGILGYAGTSNERAQATLDCFIAELHKLTKGVTQAELDRAKIGLKAATIMQDESTSARAGAIAHDYFMRGRIRTLDEIKKAIDAVSLEKLNAYLAAHQLGPFTVVTVGPKELNIPA